MIAFKHTNFYTDEGKKMENGQDMPKYLRIAVDIAERIATGSIEPGTKLKGRSVLSSEFQVSPETIRRAMAILSDMDVVKVSTGSGIHVLDRDSAIQFISNYRSSKSIQKMRKKLYEKFEDASRIHNEIRRINDELIEYYQYRRGDLIIPVEFAVPTDSSRIGQSIGQCQIWHHTGATIIGIVKKHTIIVSPGPYYEFAADDRLLIVGDENVISRMQLFFHD